MRLSQRTRTPRHPLSTRSLTAVVVLVATTGGNSFNGRADDFQQWEDVTGKYRTEAVLLDVQGDSVRLRKRNGKTISVPLEKLNQEGRRRADQHKSKTGLGEVSRKPPSPANQETTVAHPRVRLEGGLESLPPWLVEGSPFDVMDFWSDVPAADNAAFLYLEALSDFFPMFNAMALTEEQRVHAEDTKKRMDLATRYEIAVSHDPKTSDADARDAVLAAYANGFQKLLRSQNRSRSAFEYPMDVSATSPLAGAVRQIARIARIRVERDIAQGDFESAITLIDALLRLSRDLRPRGGFFEKSTADAFESAVFDFCLVPLMQSEDLRVADIDNAINVMKGHHVNTKKLDPLLVAAKGDYVRRRWLLEQLRRKEGFFSDPPPNSVAGVEVTTRGGSVYVVTEGRGDVIEYFGLDPESQACMRRRELLELLLPIADEELLTEGIRVLEKCFKNYAVNDHESFKARLLSEEQSNPDLMHLLKKTAQRLEAKLMAEGPPTTPEEMQTRLLRAVIAEDKVTSAEILNAALDGQLLKAISLGSPVMQEAHLETNRRGMTCLLALRRWFATNNAAPVDLAEVLTEAGYEGPAVDAFSGEPLRMLTLAEETKIENSFDPTRTIFAGETVIYSVGPDGKDDGGIVESFPGTTMPGDTLFRLEKPASAFRGT
jgi:hypothetical protein